MILWYADWRCELPTTRLLWQTGWREPVHLPRPIRTTAHRRGETRLPDRQTPGRPVTLRPDAGLRLSTPHSTDRAEGTLLSLFSPHVRSRLGYDSRADSWVELNRMVSRLVMSWFESIFSEVAWVMSRIESIPDRSSSVWVESIHFLGKICVVSWIPNTSLC